MSIQGKKTSSQVSAKKQEENFGPVSYGYGWRHIVTLLTFFGFLSLYTLRVNLSVGLVAMLNHTAIRGTGKSKGSICKQERDNKTDNENDGPFVWNSELQGIILGSFFYGYIVTQIPGGILAGRYGAKWVFGVGSLGTAVLTLLTPPAAEIGAGTLIGLRVVEGIFEGVTWPATQSLFSKWAPPSERSKLPAFAIAGCWVGTPLTFVLSGVMIESGLMGGWPSVFYIFGILGCVWFIFWAVLASSSPEDHKFINVDERTYIVKSLEKEHAGGITKPGFRDVPWKEILKSPAVWSVVVAHFSFGWALYVLLTSLPSYFKNVLGFNIKKNGFLSALPYVCQTIVHVLSGFVADTLRLKFGVATVTVRKCFDCLGHLLPAIFVITVGYVGCNHTAAIVCLVLSVGFSGLCGGGFFVNFLDIAPRYAGILFGISNTVATMSGIIGPYVTGVITKSNTIEAWRTIFYIVGGIYFVSVVFFAVFARGTIQTWAQPKTELSESVKLKPEVK